LRKFKTGDTVRINVSFTGAAKAGATATVQGYDGRWLTIEWNRIDGLAGEQMDGNYFESSFDLVTPEPARPRFITAWITSDGFTATGEAFMTLEDAEKCVEATLRQLGAEDQLAVFEIRSVQLARLVVTKEVA